MMTEPGIGPVWWWLIGAVVAGTAITGCLFGVEWLIKQLWHKCRALGATTARVRTGRRTR
jgi:hypothetical protein